jgi:hypothetical protein
MLDNEADRQLFKKLLHRLWEMEGKPERLYLEVDPYAISYFPPVGKTPARYRRWLKGNSNEQRAKSR